jgi:hypothetical protein
LPAQAEVATARRAPTRAERTNRLFIGPSLEKTERKRAAGRHRRAV